MPMMADPKASVIADVSTPCLLVDLDRAEKNCERMLEHARTGEVALRAHMKTAKTLEGGLLQTGGTKRKITVSTLAEAEFYCDGGFDDILLSSILTDSNKIQRAISLSERLEKFRVMVDSEAAVNLLTSHPLPDGKQWTTFLFLDIGYSREGILYDSPDIMKVAKLIQSSPSIRLEGVYTHEGNSYDQPGKGDDAFEQARVKMLQVVTELREAGIECPQVTVGSTPSCSHSKLNMEGLTEIHPGNFVFYDVENARLGSCKEEDIAVRVATRITGVYPEKGQILTDSGFTAHSHDGKEDGSGFRMVVQGHPELRMAGMCQEVGKLKAQPGFELDWDKYALGDMLFIYPWHSCATANMYQMYQTHRGESLEQPWVPAKGW